MEKPFDIPTLQLQACSALQSLALLPTDSKTRIADSGAVPALVRAMLLRPINYDIQRNACGALMNLAHNHLNNSERILRDRCNM